MIEPDIIKHICRTNEPAIINLETHTNDPGRAVKPGTVGIAQSDRHERAMMGSPHPPGNKDRYAERFDHFTDSGKTALGTDNHNRIIFTNVTSRNQTQTLGTG
jgi:hypothetical protein